jgi:hypothetical protein
LTVIGESLTRFPRRNLRFLQGKRRQAFARIPVSLATVQFSRSAKRQTPGTGSPGPGPASRRRGAGLSKLNSMRPPRVTRGLPCGLPGPVDISSGRTRAQRTRRS